MDIERALKLSDRDNSVPLAIKVLKLSEEAGEVSSEFLAECGASNASKSAGGTPYDVVTECCDVINCALDIINQYKEDVPYEEVQDIFSRKLDKWESKIPNEAKEK